MAIDYYNLPALDASSLRCEFLMENRMQCPTRAKVWVNGRIKHLCAFHFNNMVAEGTEFKLIEAVGTNVTDVATPVPAQRTGAEIEDNKISVA